MCKQATQVAHGVPSSGPVQGGGGRGRENEADQWDRTHTHRTTDHDSAGPLLTKHSREGTAMKRTRKLKEMRPNQGQQPPQHRYRHNLGDPRRRPENPTPQDGKETKAVSLPAENHLLPRLSRAGLSNRRLMVSAVIRCSYPTRICRRGIPAIRNEQKTRVGDLLCACCVPAAHATRAVCTV